jgi:hypothetical protein
MFKLLYDKVQQTKFVINCGFDIQHLQRLVNTGNNRTNILNESYSKQRVQFETKSASTSCRSVDVVTDGENVLDFC